MRLPVIAAFLAAAGFSAELTESELARRDSLWFSENPHSLPRWETLEERRQKAAYFAERIRSDSPPPPGAASLRYVAEYERMDGVLIRYPFGITLALIRELARDGKLYCLASTSQQAAARTALEQGGVDMANVHFIAAATDSYWTRDYTPWPVFSADGSPGLVDFTYNRPRAADDASAAAIGRALGLPVQFMNLVHAGGNFMGDGFTAGASTDLVYAENDSSLGISAGEVDRRISLSLGVGAYGVTADPTGAEIRHIDTWAKFLAPDKVLIRRVPSSHAQYREIEEAAAYFASRPSAYGGRYRVFRVDTPNNEPYVNSLILNGKVLVAVMGTVRDAAALQAYRQAMPGYQVLGFTGTWRSTDALHCRTFGIFDSGLLHITHIPLRDTLAAGAGGFAVEAEIAPHSGRGLMADSLILYHKTAAQTEYSRVVLTPAAGARFRAQIPAPGASAEIHYYLHAADSSGRSENHPFIGAPDPHRFYARIAPTALIPRRAPSARPFPSRRRDVLGRLGRPAILPRR